MAYTKTTWINNQAPAINADNLNKIEDGIYNSVRYADAQTLTDKQKKQARANIAAAPDGFGLGANGYPNPYTVVTGATIDALNESGLFWYRDADTPIYPDGNNSGTVGNLLHINGDTNNTLASHQIFYPYLPYGGVALNISCMRMKTDGGNWQPWEWVNPPLKLGEEYRTTERYLGKPVYVKLVDFGTLPNTDTKSVTWAAPDVVLAVLSVDATLNHGDPLGMGASLTGGEIAATKTTLYVKTSGNYSDNTAVFILKYTKVTD